MATPFNAAIIVTIVWIDNHAHYTEMKEGGGGRGEEEEGSWKLLGHVVVPWRSDGAAGLKGGNEELRGDVSVPPGCMGKLVCSEHLICVSQSNYLREQRLAKS